jgi:hypothetical protein
MCVYMYFRFVENHPIRILEDGPLISEVVLSQPIRCSNINLGEVLQNFTGAQLQFPINYLSLPEVLVCRPRCHAFIRVSGM